MPTDLDQQLPRFAETLDLVAGAISIDEILGRRTVEVEVDLLKPSAVSWIDTTFDHDEHSERGALVELVPAVAAGRPARRRVALKVALGIAAAAVLVVTMTAIVRTAAEPDPADVPPPTELPTTELPTTELPTTELPTTELPTSGGMWPQSTLEEVRAAQELADAGDPAYTWQVDAHLAGDYWGHVVNGGQVELVDRFLREVLGWEAYVFNVSHEGDRNAEGAIDGAFDGMLTDQRFLRCAPGQSNPLYPPGPEPEIGELCAPTLDNLSYESVSMDLVQLDRQGNDGIWVVNRWKLTAPFAQADPMVVEALITKRLGAFLDARIAGTGAEGLVIVFNDLDVPLLYTTAAGAPYERYEVERVDGPHWPDSFMTLSVRLFADEGATVVEQEIRSARSGALWMDSFTTTENGQPVVLPYTSTDGEVSISVPSAWETWSGGGTNHELAPEVWFWEFYRDEFGDDDRIEFTDPVAYDAWCAAQGGKPLLSAPADAAAIAQQLVADPNFETTTPVAARIGGLDALSIDVALAPGGKACGVGYIDISRWVHTIGWSPSKRLRLYLVDLPEGMSVPTMAITVVASKERFDEVIAETAPIIESIEFHPGN